ncbi:DUF2533 family protein [Bacillus sp. FJAT-45350]|uniref:DUF2533 family protein n=1 Tax=Bacillus sp. FJAT-45350 TaxID=2011014 RepID=UPI000BB7F2A8|nr:DUF2533 family protein [Bacillus sp. FJAT-45350]
MSVHLQIASQINKHLDGQKEFRRLDMMREEAIARTIAEAKKVSDFSVQEINQITNEMNQLAKKFSFPVRKNVTKEMVIDYTKNSN